MQTNHKSTFRTTINAPLEKVWNALTNPELVAKYLFGTKQETNWKVGSPIKWSGEYEGTKYVDKGTVLEYNANEKLSYSYLSSWSAMEDKEENYLFVVYKVNALGKNTELTITQSNYSEEKAKDSIKNWTAVIDGLKKLVEE
jgi:uncharacterized protein YndB with AHSA1/START domain